MVVNRAWHTAGDPGGRPPKVRPDPTASQWRKSQQQSYSQHMESLVSQLAPPAPVLDPAEVQRTYDLDRAHVFHSWSAQAQLQPMVVTAAAGSWIWDGAGRPLLDFSGQLVYTNVGHQHPKLVQGIKDQAELLCTIAPQHANAARSEAAAMIAQRTPGSDLTKIFFTNGGTEAIEHAVRMAKLHTGRPKVLARYRSYHGGTQTALNLTGDPRRWPNDTGTAGVVHFFGPFRYRSQFYAQDDAEECARALAHLEQVIIFEGPQTIAAIVLETVPGTAGIMVPPAGYLAGVRALCDRYGICWIADEVMSGFGRTGAWFAVSDLADGATPDLITFAKGVTSGYVPLGGVVLSSAIAESFASRPYPGGLTYSGHPLACAAAVSCMTLMTEEQHLAQATRMGAQVLGPGLRELAERHDLIGDIRGLGVFWAIELVTDRESNQPLVPYNAQGSDAAPMARILAGCKQRGLLPFMNMNRLHFVPPCNISDPEAQLALAILDEVLTEFKRG